MVFFRIAKSEQGRALDIILLSVVRVLVKILLRLSQTENLHYIHGLNRQG